LHEQLMRGRLPPELAFEDAALGRGSRRGVPRGQVLPGPGIPPPAHSVASIDPFRNFAAEAGWRPAAAASSGSTRKSATSGAAANLGKLFAPPEELLCRDPATGGPAGMDVAVSEALRQRKWLLINVQQADEFASHQLNRDVWRNKAIAALVRDHFVFCQLSLATAEGARYRSLYRPPGVPSVALIDPETKQKIWDCHADALQDVDMADRFADGWSRHACRSCRAFGSFRSGERGGAHAAGRHQRISRRSERLCPCLLHLCLRFSQYACYFLLSAPSCIFACRRDRVGR